MPASRGGAAPAPPALSRRWRIRAVIFSPRQAEPYPGTSGAARARFARPSGHTLAAPENPG
jgi:hypothetical protein